LQFVYAAFHSSCIRNLTERANISQVKNVSTVSGDLAFLRLDAKKNIKNYIDEQIPFEHEKDTVALEDRKDLRTRHEVLAIMLAFVLVVMMQENTTLYVQEGKNHTCPKYYMR
jgi:hypothetical protein